MGSSGWSIDLTPKKGGSPASKSKLKEELKQFLGRRWDAALPQAQAAAAWDWIALGADSLLTLFDSEDSAVDEEDDGPVDELLFMFYETVEWPEALAEHWLALALSEGRAELERILDRLGYSIPKQARFPQDEHRFVVDGERLGHPEEDGVFWQLPEYDFTEYEELPEALRATAQAIRDGAPCQCAYCARLAPAAKKLASKAKAKPKAKAKAKAKATKKAAGRAR